ncbi:hypothetical protein GLOTRDRAFT_128816 [Gloeophyllum trabeum ATCC 11539]|uniref:DUF6533 domain-containing protein n=1 Tax=Gloeophyllum trabeum (strain ATCC 11539 / FP-39264 / Madison 617) TaxID=670483 RepID=S7Q821_GLOTA|nr:uncharacterized protein GLOTRDRAFT_128816 [Gloeophyllum trabeum ATCC 11539]EPQ55593.1 hypothetical protein GLOTRDRAFT_128816 [Gloeophyllum trabeum ATCC 11539]
MSASTNVVVAAQRLQVVRYTQVASMAVLIAEWCFVIGEEVEYVWKGRWTYLKVFYLLSRYTPFLDTPFNLLNYLTPRIKPEASPLTATSTFVGMSISEYILIARTYALYGRSRTIGLFMLITVSICTVAGAITLSLFEVSLVFGPLPSPEIPGCILSEGSNIAFVNFIILLGWEFFIVCLTAYRGIRDLRISRGPMAQTLYRDGIFFFFILLLLSTANIIVFVVAPLEYLDLVDTLTRCLHSIICCRVLLNLRGAANDTGSGAPSTGRPVSSLRFMKVLGARRTPADSEFDSTVGDGSLPLHELGSSRPADPELER